jgi:hypothetical protein
MEYGRQSTHEDFTFESAPAASSDFTTSSLPLWAAIIKGVQIEPIDFASVASLTIDDVPKNRRCGVMVREVRRECSIHERAAALT